MGGNTATHMGELTCAFLCGSHDMGSEAADTPKEAPLYLCGGGAQCGLSTEREQPQLLGVPLGVAALNLVGHRAVR